MGGVVLFVNRLVSPLLAYGSGFETQMAPFLAKNTPLVPIRIPLTTNDVISCVALPIFESGDNMSGRETREVKGVFRYTVLLWIFAGSVSSDHRYLKFGSSR